MESKTGDIRTENGIPDWMLETTVYEPEKDHDGFITKSILKLLGLLSRIRENGAPSVNTGGAAMKLIVTLLSILLTAISRNMFFTYVLLSVFLLRLVFLSEKVLGAILKSALGAALFSAIILLPSIFLGSPQTMLTVSIKVFLSVGLVGLLASSTPWNQITETLKIFHVPDVFIFVFDLTLKYIAILGEICFQMLTALQMRSVGKNHKKGRALSGILGVTFLKSQAMAEEMFEAMACRGFEGEYVKRREELFSKKDLPLLFGAILMIAVFVFTQVSV